MAWRASDFHLRVLAATRGALPALQLRGVTREAWARFQRDGEYPRSRCRTAKRAITFPPHRKIWALNKEGLNAGCQRRLITPGKPLSRKGSKATKGSRPSRRSLNLGVSTNQKQQQNGNQQQLHGDQHLLQDEVALELSDRFPSDQKPCLPCREVDIQPRSSHARRSGLAATNATPALRSSNTTLDRRAATNSAQRLRLDSLNRRTFASDVTRSACGAYRFPEVGGLVP